MLFYQTKTVLVNFAVLLNRSSYKICLLGSISHMSRLQTTLMCAALSRAWQVNQVIKSKIKTVYFSAENLRADMLGFILHIQKTDSDSC